MNKNNIFKTRLLLATTIPNITYSGFKPSFLDHDKKLEHCYNQLGKLRSKLT